MKIKTKIEKKLKIDESYDKDYSSTYFAEVSFMISILTYLKILFWNCNVNVKITTFFV